MPPQTWPLTSSRRGHLAPLECTPQGPLANGEGLATLQRPHSSSRPFGPRALALLASTLTRNRKLGAPEHDGLDPTMSETGGAASDGGARAMAQLALRLIRRCDSAAQSRLTIGFIRFCAIHPCAQHTESHTFSIGWMSSKVPLSVDRQVSHLARGSFGP